MLISDEIVISISNILEVGILDVYIIPRYSYLSKDISSLLLHSLRENSTARYTLSPTDETCPFLVSLDPSFTFMSIDHHYLRAVNLTQTLLYFVLINGNF